MHQHPGVVVVVVCVSRDVGSLVHDQDLLACACHPFRNDASGKPCAYNQIIKHGLAPVAPEYVSPLPWDYVTNSL
jgi:hypothetical protein